MKKTIIILVVIIALAILGFYVINMPSSENVDTEKQETVDTFKNNEDQSEETQEASDPKSVIGKSIEDRDIDAYTYGDGEKHLLFVGGIHGGYSWNTALVAYNLIDYLEENLDSLSENLKVTVIPVLNPDGLNKVVGTTENFSESNITMSQEETVTGRFNADGVDLNRNFDCDWKAEGTWQSRTVSGGTEAFSEPESIAIKSFVEANNPDAVVVWYSAVGGVFASNCHNGVLAETKEILNTYADASGYRAFEEFNFYEITGDMTNWLANIGTPAISVLLTTHSDVEWEKNLKGIKAIFDHYTEEIQTDTE